MHNSRQELMTCGRENDQQADAGNRTGGGQRDMSAKVRGGSRASDLASFQQRVPNHE
jgi:hypothetical protein